MTENLQPEVVPAGAKPGGSAEETMRRVVFHTVSCADDSKHTLPGGKPPTLGPLDAMVEPLPDVRITNLNRPPRKPEDAGKDLGSTDWLTSRHAMKELEYYGVNSLPTILQGLKSNDKMIETSCRELLNKLMGDQVGSVFQHFHRLKHQWPGEAGNGPAQLEQILAQGDAMIAHFEYLRDALQGTEFDLGQVKAKLRLAALEVSNYHPDKMFASPEAKARFRNNMLAEAFLACPAIAENPDYRFLLKAQLASEAKRLKIGQ